VLRGSVSIGGKIDGASTLKIHAYGDIRVGDKIDGASNVDFYTETGHVIINGYIGNSNTVIRYHSPYPISYIDHSDITPVKY
jgi:hypothetical protein